MTKGRKVQGFEAEGHPRSDNPAPTRRSVRELLRIPKVPSFLRPSSFYDIIRPVS